LRRAASIRGRAFAPRKSLHARLFERIPLGQKGGQESVRKCAICADAGRPARAGAQSAFHPPGFSGRLSAVLVLAICIRRVMQPRRSCSIQGHAHVGGPVFVLRPPSSLSKFDAALGSKAKCLRSSLSAASAGERRTVISPKPFPNSEILSKQKSSLIEKQAARADLDS
jgi:hypothetical protein